MKLTKLQIQQLYKFTQKHYVDWYDVQTELVDHLANGIEKQLTETPNLTFESALKTEFKKFGIMGFNDVIEEKTKALNKQYRILVWQYFKAYFKLPKIIMTLFFIWGYYNLLVFIENRFWVILPTAVLIYVIPIWQIYKQSKKIKSIKKQTNKKWLFDNVSLQLGGIVYFLNIAIQITFFDIDSVWGKTWCFIFSILIILFSLTIYISIFIVSPKLRNEMIKQHPEYKTLNV